MGADFCCCDWYCRVACKPLASFFDQKDVSLEMNSSACIKALGKGILALALGQYEYEYPRRCLATRSDDAGQRLPQ